METQRIINWITAFLLKAKALSCSEPYIFVALSRKMPRLLDVIFTQLSKIPPKDLDLSLIPVIKSKLVTEHAIPFIWGNTDWKSPKPIILDDIIINGHALLPVANHLHAFTDTKILLEVICQAVDAAGVPLITPEELDLVLTSPNPIKVTNYSETVDYFITLIENYNLPVDVEFPVMHLKPTEKMTVRGMYDFILDKAKSRYGEYVYEMANTIGHRHSTILLNRANDTLYNNDFSKIRIFETDNELRIATFAPNIIEDSKLTQPSLFLNPSYANIWSKVLDQAGYPFIPEISEWTFDTEDRREYNRAMRVRLSLTVFANYLFSLSTLIAHKDLFAEFLPNPHGYLSKSDLNLLLGPSLAQELLPDLENLISSGEQTTRVWSEVRLPDMVVPEEVSHDYQFMSTVKTLEANSLETALKGIFQVGYQIKSSLKFTRNPFKPYVPMILESFKSLLRKPSKLFLTEDVEIRVNEIVDSMIDRGVVTPCYHRLKGEDGRYYWRRYFRGSHKIISKDGLCS